MWESISSGAIGFSIKDGRQIGEGEKRTSSFNQAKQQSWLPIPLLLFPLAFSVSFFCGGRGKGE